VSRTKRTLVLSGGGSRGALQAGAFQALFEAGYQPDMVVGTSIGAFNGALLGLHGWNQAGLDAVKQAYQQAAALDVLPYNYVQLTLRALFKRPASEPSRMMREFFISQGITPELQFSDLKVDLIAVSTDLNACTCVLNGQDPAAGVLEALCTSTALPPWVVPVELENQLLMDGGIVSNLPVEPALAAGARDIVALDVQEHRELPAQANGFGPFCNKLVNTVQRRQFELEFAVASAARVPVKYIHLYADTPVPLYDFERWEELVERGYELTQRQVSPEDFQRRSWWHRLTGQRKPAR